jgi:hypothetical protein
MATCQPAAGPAYCADTQTDTNNCGRCFNVCPAGAYCQGATCVPQGGQPDAGTLACTPPQVPCDNTYCTDFSKDINNCGGCHLLCGAAQACVQGKCM